LKELMQGWNENSVEHADIITRVRSQLNDVTSDLRANVDKLQTRAEALGALGSRADYVVEVSSDYKHYADAVAVKERRRRMWMGAIGSGVCLVILFFLLF
jgi:hypothetical protein